MNLKRNKFWTGLHLIGPLACIVIYFTVSSVYTPKLTEVKDDQSFTFAISKSNANNKIASESNLTKSNYLAVMAYDSEMINFIRTNYPKINIKIFKCYDTLKATLLSIERQTIKFALIHSGENFKVVASDENFIRDKLYGILRFLNFSKNLSFLSSQDYDLLLIQEIIFRFNCVNKIDELEASLNKYGRKYYTIDDQSPNFTHDVCLVAFFLFAIGILIDMDSEQRLYNRFFNKVEKARVAFALIAFSFVKFFLFSVLYTLVLKFFFIDGISLFTEFCVSLSISTFYLIHMASITFFFKEQKLRYTFSCILLYISYWLIEIPCSFEYTYKFILLFHPSMIVQMRVMSLIKSRVFF